MDLLIEMSEVGILHVPAARALEAALVVSGKIHDVLTLGRGFFARSIEEHLRLAGVLSHSSQLQAQSHGLVSSFFALLDWAVDHGMAWNEVRKRANNPDLYAVE